jgi:chorismate--pyruvate lyase
MARWKPYTHYLHPDIPRPLCSWLLDTASLTKRLQQLCAGEFRVRVLSQESGRPTLDEARALEMKPGGKALIRQVQLLCDGQPWVYARTIIPATSLCGKLRRLAHLGTRPLGGMLFADPGMRRERVELACIRKGEPMYLAAMQKQRARPAAVWGRRAVFRIADKPLLVSEVFLPAFPAGSATPPLWKSR